MTKPNREEQPAESAAEVAQAQTTASSDAPPREPGDEPASERKHAPDPFGISGNFQAGVRLLEHRRFRRAEIAFSEGKPSQAVIDRLKTDGFRWNPQDQLWTRPIGREDAMATRTEAERTYQAVVEMILQQKGLAKAEQIGF